MAQKSKSIQVSVFLDIVSGAVKGEKYILEVLGKVTSGTVGIILVPFECFIGLLEYESITAISGKNSCKKFQINY